MELKPRSSTASPQQRLVAFALAAAALAWWLPSTLGTEVYPSVSLPSFGPVPEAGPSVDFVFEVANDGRTQRLDTAQVLDGVRSSAWPNIAEALGAHPDDPEALEWLAARAAAVTGACHETVRLVRVAGGDRRVLLSATGCPA